MPRTEDTEVTEGKEGKGGKDGRTGVANDEPLGHVIFNLPTPTVGRA
jgi:hypothetical protein